MRRGSNPQYHIGKIMEMLILVILLISLPISSICRSSADPIINDNLDSTKTAKWNFQNPNNYTDENVTVASWNANLKLLNGSWLQTSYSDFSSGWNDTNSTVTPDGNITLWGNTSNLIENGDFSVGGNWSYVSSTDGNITAGWSGDSAEFTHASAYTDQFDDMDYAAQDLRWWPSGTAPPMLDDETVIKAEGESSLKLTWNPDGNVTKAAGIYRNDSGTWDWSRYNRLKFWAITDAVPITLNISVTLYNLTSGWSSPNQTVFMDPTWKDNDFDIYIDSAFLGNLSVVEKIELNFGGVVTQTSVLVDNITLFRQLDDMDTSGLSKWWGTGSVQSTLSVNAFNKNEGTSSLSNLWDPSGDPTNWVEIYRDEVGIWNWSQYGNVRIWANNQFGVGGLNMSVFLYNLTDRWTSSAMDVAMGWNPYLFNISAAFNSDLSVIDRFGIVFTNTSALTTALVDNITIFKQFDSMEPPNEWLATGTAGIGGLMLDSNFKVEGIFSLNLTFDPAGDPLKWAKIYRDDGPWNWSAYDSLSLWANTNFTGAGLNTSLTIYNQTTIWMSSPVEIVNAWAGYIFDISNAFNGDLSNIAKIEINFTGVGMLTSVYIDDIELFKQFDSMDNATVPSYWQPSGEAPPSLLGQLGNKVEGTGSLEFWWNPLSNSSKWAIVYKQSLGSLTEYNRLKIWANTTYLGSNLEMSLSLRNISSSWDSPSLTLTNGWQEYIFDLSAAPAGILSTAVRIELNFTGVSSVTTVYIDDARLSYHKVFNQTAYINQTFYKENYTDALPTRVILTLDYSVLNYTAGLESNISVWLNDTNVWNFDITSVNLWTSVYLDISQYMSPKGQYNISIRCHLKLDSPYEMVFGAELDNVSIAAPNYNNGTFVSQKYNASSIAIWKNIAWVEFLPPETDISVQVRFGNTSGEVDIASWSSPLTNSIFESIEGFNSSWIQYKVNLNTMNASKAPTFSELNISYQKYPGEGYVETEDFIPLDILSWRIFNATGYEPLGTSMTYWYSTNSGVGWTQTWPGDDLSAAPIPKIRFRANFTALDTSQTPVLTELNITYSFLGTLAYIAIVPSNPSNLSIGGTHAFEAYGFDTYDNPLGPVSVFWGVTGEIGTIDLGPSTTAMFTATAEGTGQVVASDGSGHTNSTDSFSVINMSPTILGQIPDQAKPEDYGSWSLDLAGYASDDSPLSELKWYITGNNDSLYSISGENVTGNHILTFTTRPDAFGDDLVIIWLEDYYGSKASQNLWINITPVNDAPSFQNPPSLNVEADEDYTFDYSPYLKDIDNGLGELILTVDDDFATVNGLKVTYRYPSSMGNRNVSVVLTISDGSKETNATMTINVIAPRVVMGWGWDAIMLVSFGGLGLLALILALIAFFPWLRKKKQSTVEDMFLVHGDGRLIAHYTRELRPERDEDILAGMLTAVQEFIEDSMGRDEVLSRFEFQFQEKNVMVERGKDVYLAVFLAHEPPDNAGEQLKAFIKDVEDAYKDVIPQWTGDVSSFKGLQDLMDHLFVGRGYRKGYWKKLKFLRAGPSIENLKKDRAKKEEGEEEPEENDE